MVTGGARGQGRSHAVKLAEEGADVVLFDICHDIEMNEYPLATPRDLEEAGLEVEKTGRRAYTAEVDVRDRGALARELTRAIAEFDKLDVVVANAGICPLGANLPVRAFADAFDVDFIGVVNTVHAALPYLKSGASIITTGSVAGSSQSLSLPGRLAPKDRAEPVTATPNSWWIPTLVNSPANWPHSPFVPTSFTHERQHRDAQQRANVPAVPPGPPGSHTR